jgi:hypothetical protein
MSSAGRNDPCPCGSGRKFKHCCLSARDAAQGVRRRMREAEERLIPLLWQIALETWRQDGVHEAYDRFFTDTPCPDDIMAHREHESLFLTWLGLRFAPARGEGREAMSAAAMLLDAAAGAPDGADLPDFERRFLAAAEAASPSFHVAAGVVPGEAIDLEDVLTGATCRVLESTASRIVRPGEVVYARVVTLDGVSIMVGSGSTALPPLRRADLADLRQDLAGRRGRLTAGDLRTHEDSLRHWYLLAADHEHNRPLPTITNTDGEPLEPTTLTFTLKCSPAEAFAALKALDRTHTDEDQLADAELNPDGTLRAFTLGWTKPGNRRHHGLDNTVLGHLQVEGTALTAEVNSRKRATRVRREIEKRLGGRVRFDRTEILSMESMLEQARERALAEGPPPLPELPPEVLAELERRQQAHWDAWIDEPVPALKGQTPREAAKTPAGRERLEALLADFALHGDVPVAQLRKALGF